MYTSGTTGDPKGAVLTHGNVLFGSINTVVGCGINRSYKSLVVAPLFHIGALGAAALPVLYAGGSLYLKGFYNASEVVGLICREKINYMFAVPVMFQLLTQTEEWAQADFSHVHFFIAGGAPMPLPVIRKYQQDKGIYFAQGYGLTETFRLRHNLRFTDIHNDYDSYYPSFFYGPTGQSDFPYNDPEDRTITRVKSISTADTQVLNTDTNLEARFATGPVSHKVLGGVDTAMFVAQQRYGDAIDNTPFDLYDPHYGQPESLGIPDYDPVTGEFIGFIPVSAVPVFDLPDQDVTQTGLYVQDQIRLGPWIAVVGLRQDWITNKSEFSEAQEDDAISYRAGLMYELPFGLTPYVSYAESFVPVIGLGRLGNTFDPQEGVMYEAGFKYELPGSAFAINGAVYDITESNRLASDPVNPSFSIQTGEVSIQGFEIETVGNLTRNIMVAGGYSYTDAQYTGGDQEGFRVESVPYHLASMWAYYTFDQGLLRDWSVGAGFRYIGVSWDGTDTLQTPAVGLVDAAIAYDTDDYRFAVNATNLEDKEYLTTCLSRGDCFVGTRRTVISSFTYKF
jgi:iron complex outermembrane receptor protein